MIGVLRTGDLMLLDAVDDQHIAWAAGWFEWKGRDIDVVTGTRLGHLVLDGYLDIVDRRTARSDMTVTDRGRRALTPPTVLPEVEGVLR